VIDERLGVIMQTGVNRMGAPDLEEFTTVKTLAPAGVPIERSFARGVEDRREAREKRQSRRNWKHIQFTRMITGKDDVAFYTLQVLYAVDFDVATNFKEKSSWHPDELLQDERAQTVPKIHGVMVPRSDIIVIVKMNTKERIRALASNALLGLFAAGLASGMYAKWLISPSLSNALWISVFIMASLAAFLGGVYHFSPGMMSEPRRRNVWKLTVTTIALAGCAVLIAAAAVSFAGILFQTFVVIAFIKLAVALYLLLRRDGYKPVMYDYGISLIVTAVFYLVFIGGAAAVWITAGVALTIIGSVMQARGVKMSKYLDHNDLYHLVETVALVMMYAGVK